MSASNYPQFSAAVSELTGQVDTLIQRVRQTDTAVNIALAEQAALAAGNSETSASQSAQQAGDAATQAVSAATSVDAGVAASAQSADTAATHATSAAQSSEAAAAARDTAADWAELTEDMPIAPGQFSAKHHASKAAVSAAAASSSAVQAESSKSAAELSKVSATERAAEAEISATSAAGSAASAAASAASATTKEAEARTSAQTAVTKAAEAVTSASQASLSASDAATSASQASASELAAKASEVAAGASEQNVVTLATQAQVDASSAGSSAASAAGSELAASQWAELPEDQAVEAGKFSALHHAAKAAVSAGLAASYAATIGDSATTSVASASAAEASAATATLKASEADASASTAVSKAAEAADHAAQAQTSSTASQGSAEAAVASEGKALRWAEEAVGVPVEPGKYSAKHHAESAQTDAAAALAAKQVAEAAGASALSAESGAVAAASEAAGYRDQAQAAAASVVGGLVELGGVDLSGAAYPAKPTSGAFWKVTVAGTVDGVEYGVGDTLVYSKNLDQFYKIDNTESVTSVQGEKGVVVLTAQKVGALPADGTALAAEKLSTSRLINGVPFDGTEDITVADPTKEPAVPAGAVSQFWAGDKTWKDLAAAVRAATLVGLSTVTGTAISATDSLLAGLGKLQAQINSLSTGKLDAGATAAASQRLATARNINGVPFDGTEDITVADATKEPAISVGSSSQFWAGDKSWKDLAGAVRSVALAGLSTSTSTAITAVDTVLTGLGKLQAQVNSLSVGKLDTGATAAAATKLATARTINGTPFDGTQNITVSDASKEPAIAAGSASQFWAGDKTWKSFDDVARGVTMAGISMASAVAVAATDTLLGAVGKLQSQLTALDQAKVDTGDARLSDAREWTAATVGQAEAEAGTATTRRAWSSLRIRQAIAAWWATVADTKLDVGATAAAAAKLATARTINGVAFDGTANISVVDATKLPLSGGRITGNVTIDTGFDGGYGAGNGGTTDWGACIWGMGPSYDGSGANATYSPAGSYGVSWLRAAHASADAQISEGAYIYRAGVLVGGIGLAGIKTAGVFYGNGSGITALNASNISTGTLPIARGGTGGTTAAAALTALGIGSMATRNVTISASNPSGGADGDVWFKV